MTTLNGPAPDSRAVIALHELALASTTLIGDQDVIGTTTSFLAGCVRATGAAAAGLVVARPDDQLELLASTSHRAHELELYQLQVDEGPCVEAVRTIKPTTVTGLRQIAVRWPTMVEAFRNAGFEGAHGAPLIWHGEALGAINLFFVEGSSAEGVGEVAQMFADLATIAIVHSGRLSAQDVVERSRAALDERIVIERAKGVLAYAEDLALDEAFDLLLALAVERGRPLGEVAAQVIDEATG